MKFIPYAVLAAFLLLQGCDSRPEPGTGSDSSGAGSGSDSSGDSDGSGDSDDSDDTKREDLTIRAISDRTVIQTGGTDIARITALVTNDDNQAEAGQSIGFKATGGVLQNMELETDENGQATAELRLAGDKQNQDITVTVNSGTAVAEVLVSASGSNIGFAGPTSLVLGDTANLAVTLTAGNSEPIANEEITFRLENGNTIEAESSTTDTNGKVNIKVGSANGSETIYAFALNDSAVGKHELEVAQDLLQFTSPATGTEVPVGSSRSVTAKWVSQGNPVVGKNLRFGITAGQVNGSSEVVTNSNGEATVHVSSVSAGKATISVSAFYPAGGGTNGDPSTQTEIEFIATNPSQIEVESANSRVPTGDSATITALVEDANGNPVKNVEVEFYSADLKGGQLNPASTRTDSEGKAQVSFTAGKLATEFEEIELLAKIVGKNVVGSTRLTVVERVLNVTLGTSGLLYEIADGAQYGLPFAVQVADGSGAPLKDAEVVLSIVPVSYDKGYYITAVNANNQPVWERQVFAVCPSEDLNGNRLLDAGEDVNNNGTLDPQDPAVIAAHSEYTPTVEGGVLTTDDNGSGYFLALYPASNSMWAEVDIVARASALGVEAEEVFNVRLPVLAKRVNDVSQSPPNHYSPYGTSNNGQITPGVCTDEL